MQSLMTRTPQIIAAEINSIKEQTQRILLHNSIEIGRRLSEAKEVVGHGNWTEWLENSVDYSQRTASNLIRIFDEFGAKQLMIFDENSNSQALANLTYTQAVALIGIPSEDREEFIEKNKIDEMTTRQLNDAIKERDTAIKAMKEAEKKLAQAESDKRVFEESKKTLEISLEMLEKTSQGAKSEAEGLRNQLDALQNRIEELDKEVVEKPVDDKELETVMGELKELRNLYDSVTKELNVAKNKIEELEDQEEPEPQSIEVIPKEIEDELKVLRIKLVNGEQAAKFGVIFKTAQNQINELIDILEKLDDEIKPKYKMAIQTLLEKTIEVIG